ncbi:hypothetical protein ACWDQO_29820 [Streptomyces sp. NPDC003703]|uniref:hypothetical protein n=1 Tax=Streptomyces sp. NPDC003283 TaxID=3364681 RepID=UPI00369A7436
MPTATTYAYHFRKVLTEAGITKPDGSPIHEVSRWLGHRSIKTTVDVYGHLVPASWDRCRTIMQTALRPDSMATVPSDEASGTPHNPEDPV